MNITTICCLGGNDEGGILCSVIAFKCPEIRVDVLDNEAIISKWNKNGNPVKEPGLDKMLLKCRNRNLFFSSNYNCLKHADLVFICSDLPFKKKGFGGEIFLDIKPLEDAARTIAAHGESDMIVVERSGAPKAAEGLSLVLNMNAHSGVHYQVLTNPEFWGHSLDNLLNNKVLIGCPTNSAGRQAAEALSRIYQHWIPRKDIAILSTWSVRLAKLGQSSFIAQKLTSMNALGEICEKTGADVSEILRLMLPNEKTYPEPLNTTLDISEHKPNLQALILTCQSYRTPEVVEFWQKVVDYSDYHKERFIEKLSEVLSPLTNKDISIWGFNSKSTPPLLKDSPGFQISKFLLSQGAKVKIYEPRTDKHEILSTLSEWKGVGNKMTLITKDPYEASADAQAIIVCDDCENVNEINFLKICDKMKKPSIVLDGKRCLEGSLMTRWGFEYHTVGTG